MNCKGELVGINLGLLNKIKISSNLSRDELIDQADLPPESLYRRARLIIHHPMADIRHEKKNSERGTLWGSCLCPRNWWDVNAAPDPPTRMSVFDTSTAPAVISSII